MDKLRIHSLSFSKIILLGIAQILLWGGSYFLLSILGEKIMSEMMWSYQKVYGCLSIALFISGLVLPKIGKIIQSNSKHNMLFYAGIVMALGLLIIGLSNNFTFFVFGWVIIGIGMGMGLYDSLFAFIGQRFTDNAKKSIIWITLISSLAPSISWFFINVLLENLGWRNTCYVYALLLLVIVCPIHWYVFNIKGINSSKESLIIDDKTEVLSSKKLYTFLSMNFIIGSIITTALIIHLIDILLYDKMEMSSVLFIVAFLGPSQSAARIIELIVGKRGPIEMSFISAFAMFLGVILIFLNLNLPVTLFGVISFGIGNGMRSVLRGTLPLSIYGKNQYSFIIGKLGKLPLLAQALTPFIGSYIIDKFDMSIFLTIILTLAILNIMTVFVLKNILNKKRITINTY